MVTEMFLTLIRGHDELLAEGGLVDERKIPHMAKEGEGLWR